VTFAENFSSEKAALAIPNFSRTCQILTYIFIGTDFSLNFPQYLKYVSASMLGLSLETLVRDRYWKGYVVKLNYVN